MRFNPQQQPQNRRRNDYRASLMGKVVLLVGSDQAVLQRLTAPLARKGADIAVLCPELSAESVEPVCESVEAAGQRFLLVEESTAPDAAERVIQAVTAALGHLDIFIDLSAHTAGLWPATDHQPAAEEAKQPDWLLAYAALAGIIGT